jgi:hypothetical protein
MSASSTISSARRRARSLRSPSALALQAPGNAPEQKLPVRRPGFFSKHFAVTDAQSGGFQSAKLFDFGNDGWGHEFSPFSGQ